MKRLWYSAKFWLLVLDVIVSTIIYFVAKYAGAAIEDVKFVITAYQPIVALVIIGIFGEDIALKAKTGRGGPTEPPVQ
jgi:hypothetical protein